MRTKVFWASAPLILPVTHFVVYWLGTAYFSRKYRGRGLVPEKRSVV